MRDRTGSPGDSVAEAEPRVEEGAEPQSSAAEPQGPEAEPQPDDGAAALQDAAPAEANEGDAEGAAPASAGPGVETDDAVPDAAEPDAADPDAVEPDAAEPAEPASPETAPGGTPRDGMHWFALQVYLGHENKVKNLLQRRVVELRDPSIHIGDVMVPTQEVVEVKGGKKVKVTRNLYPGYLLVEMQPNEETLHFVNNVHGVIKFLGAGKLPQPLRPREIARILGKIEEIREAPEIVEIPFDPGDAVQVTDGPFSDFHGTVEEVYPEKGKVKVTVSLFGRPTSVELDYLQLRKL